MRTKAPLALIAAVFALSISCGNAGAPGGGAQSGLLRIVSAEWQGGSEPKAVVSGEWGLGSSTPPSCSLINGEDGEAVGWYDQTVRIELDGRRFYQEFVRDPEAGREETLDPEKEYLVSCSSSGDTGKSSEAVAPVEGKVPTT